MAGQAAGKAARAGDTQRSSSEKKGSRNGRRLQKQEKNKRNIK